MEWQCGFCARGTFAATPGFAAEEFSSMVIYKSRPWPIRFALSPFALRRQKRRVALFHLGRSGSTVLASVFRQPGTCVDGEIVEDYLERRLDWKWDKFERPAKAAAAPAIDLQRYLLLRLRLGYAENYFCEFKPFQLRLCGSSVSDAVAACRALGFDSFATLERRNLLRIVVSALRAREHDLWQSKAGKATPPLTIDLDRVPHDRCVLPLVEMLAKLERDWREIEEATPPEATRLVYEDHIERDPMLGARLLSQATGMQHVSEAPIQRIGGRPLAEEVANWEAVKERLEGTRFAWMAESGGSPPRSSP